MTKEATNRASKAAGAIIAAAVLTGCCTPKVPDRMYGSEYHRCADLYDKIECRAEQVRREQWIKACMTKPTTYVGEIPR